MKTFSLFVTFTNSNPTLEKTARVTVEGRTLRAALATLPENAEPSEVQKPSGKWATLPHKPRRGW